jgi:kinetochore protein NDC80
MLNTWFPTNQIISNQQSKFAYNSSSQLLQVLSSPTTKDFTNVMLFLIRQIDPNLLKGFGKLEEEVPQLYKRLRYPFAISKSNLTAVGSPHTWPTILAALCWVVELLNYSARADTARAEMGSDRSRAERDFFEYVASSYRYFMAGEDDLCDEVDNKKAAEVETRAAQVRADSDRLSASNAALKAEIAELRKKPSPLAAAREKIAETQEDKEKFLKLIDNLTTHKVSLQRKLTERQADVSAQAQELATVETENEELRARISTQKVHPADVVRMNQDRVKHESALRTLCSQREAADAKVADAAAGLEERLDELEAVVADYHARADRLQLVPSSAKRAEGVGFEITLDRSATLASSMVNIDLKGIIKPALQRIRDHYASKARELGEESLSLAEKRDAAAEVVAERSEECTNAEAQVKDLEAQYRSGKEELEAGVAAALSQVEDLAAEVSTLRGAAAAGVVESEERLRSLQADLEELQRACELENATLHRDLAAALEAVLNHKMAVQARLKSTADRVGRVLEDVAKAPMPLPA